MRLGTVVLATDYSSGAEAAAERAVAVVQGGGGQLVVLHVSGPKPLFPMEAEALTASHRELEEVRKLRRLRGAEQLEQLAHTLLERGIEVRCELLEGPVVDVIANAGRELDADLIVTGGRGVTGDNVFPIGSVAEGVARRAHTNVLVVRGAPLAEPFRRILIATDLTEASKAAIATALAFAAPDADVELMHVVEWGDHAPPVRGPHGSPAVDFKKLWSAAIGEAERELETLVSRRTGAKLRYRVVEGVAAADIVKHAEEGGHDLVVVGKHADEPPTYASVSERVLRSAPCSVLVARRAPGALHAVL
jgi:nucleotide-binding universal stress UspA family protein